MIKKIIKFLDKITLKIIDKDNLTKVQLIVGFFGVVYGIVAFFYFFLKISQFYSLFFLLCILIGISLIRGGRKEAVNNLWSIDQRHSVST